jgi:hypothetical protein
MKELLLFLLPLIMGFCIGMIRCHWTYGRQQVDD